MKAILPALLLFLFVFNSSAQDSCDDPLTIDILGEYTADNPEVWYSFVPETDGEYVFSTCDLSTCDTKLYLYDHCPTSFNEGGLNTIAYSDDNCGYQTEISAILNADDEYFLRVGDYQTACSGQSITFSVDTNYTTVPIECSAGESLIEVVIVPDAYPNEISWDIRDADNNILAEGNFQSGSVCVDSNVCHIFNIYDSYGDGILGSGGYWLYVDDVLMVNNNNYGFGESVEIACPPGFSCLTAVEVEEGTYITPEGEYWYSFVADSTGTYEFSTCYDNYCNTKIWLYDECNGINVTEDHVGTTFYSDDEGDCGELAVLNAIMLEGETVYIRIGGYDDCDTSAIEWSVNYNGPVVGCTDPSACNYVPFATVSDTCIYPGDSLCTDGPDLTIFGDELESSMAIGTTFASFCDVEEECVTGMGDRDIIRFSTWIANIGNLDYYIGDPVDNPDQFEFENCHGHTHYKGYAEYILYDENLVPLPVGFKNGFCVMDITCWDGVAKYGCSNMGITAGCADIYGSFTQCNWIDITEVPDGVYTFVARTNWDQSPDALGHQELDYSNNWTQVCFELYHDDNDELAFDILDSCAAFVDCAGTEFGSAIPDCMGVCNGTAQMGDLSGNEVQEMDDASLYLDGIIGGDVELSPCTDLNADSAITITDAAQLADCLLYGASHPHDGGLEHDHCNFPSGYFDIEDTVKLKIAAVDWEENYIDIHMLNPYKRVVGYQFTLEGLQITNVENLADEEDYPVDPLYAFGGDQVLALSLEDSSIAKSTIYKPLCRIYFFEEVGTQTICIDEIIDVVNENYSNVNTLIEGPCVSSAVGIEDFSNPYQVSIQPHPLSDESTIVIDAEELPQEIYLLDLQGRRIRNIPVDGDRIPLKKEELSPGVYILQMLGSYTHSMQIVVQ